MNQGKDEKPGDSRDGGDSAAPRTKRGPVIPFRFLVLFGLYLILGSFSLATPWVQVRCVAPWTRANAAAAAALCRTFGMEAHTRESALSSGATTLSVKKGCDGSDAALILASAVLAFPATWRRRLLGIVLGTLAVFGFNIMRLASLLLVAVHLPTELEFMHVYFWQILICLLALGVFLVWGAFLAGKK